jgi:Na+-exporting ATPase
LPISWEWGIVFIGAALFMIVAESWKWAKRIYFRRKAGKMTAEDDMEIAFQQWMEINPTATTMTN